MTKAEKLNRRFDAYNEVYEILMCLTKEEIKKIPNKLVETIDFYRNKQHEYKINLKDNLSEQAMLPETKAILFNIFRDYLSTEDQKQKILEFQRKDKQNLMKEKAKNFEESRKKVDFKNTSDMNYTIESDVVEKKALVEVEKQSFIKQIFDKIKAIFKRNIDK